jgi:hypothetical protein
MRDVLQIMDCDKRRKLEKRPLINLKFFGEIKLLWKFHAIGDYKNKDTS